MAESPSTKDNTRDSAPGVNDGGRAGGAPPVNTRPGGRRGVFLLVAAALAVLAVVLIARPMNQPSEGGQVGLSQTQGEIAGSTVPGAPPPTAATATPGG